MSPGEFTVFLYTLWLCGFFPVDHPLEQRDVRFVSKKGCTIRRSLILAWSLVLIIYPLLFVVDICFNAEGVPVTESGRLSALIPFGIVMVSQFLINTILRLFSVLNSGKLVHLVGMLRQLSQNADSVAMNTCNSGPKWTSYFVIWFLYVGILLTAACKLVDDLATSEYELKRSKLFLLPQSDILSIFLMNAVFITTTVSPIFVFHLVFTFDSRLIQIHSYICSELRGFLADGHIIMMVNKIKTMDSSGSVQRQAVKLQEKFSSLKECFKIYDCLAGTYSFCILWWAFVVIITSLSSLTSDGLKRTETIIYGVHAMTFIYVVASFGDYMASSIDQAGEGISETLARLSRGRKFFEDNGNAAMVTNIFGFVN